MSELFMGLPQPAKKLSKANRPKTSAAGAKAQDEDHAFFPTPWEATEAFLRAERDFIRIHGNRVWEPACGEGHICKVLDLHGYDVAAHDLMDRGYGEGGRDFLKAKKAAAPVLITNPPYKDDLPERFIRHAKDMGVVYLALLLKVNFWNVQCRVPLWEKLKPVREYRLTWRLNFLNLSGGMMDCSWFVWNFQLPVPDHCRTRLLLRPDGFGLEGGAV